MPARLKATDLPSVEDRAVYTVAQFLRAHSISRGKFYDMVRKGLGPRMMKVGTRRMISVEEAARWRAKRTAARS
jgi:hypothetical protein